jgi:cytochrome b
MAVTKGRPELHVGHNPTGGWAILVMLLLGLVTTLSGWAYYAELAGHWLKEVHEAAATMMLVVVCVHIAGVLLESFLLKENLISAMLSGLKQGPASEAISSARPYAAVVLVLWIVAVSWWIAS